MPERALDTVERAVVNRLQEGFPVSDRPFLEVAQSIGLSEDELIECLARLRADGTLSRFGPMFDIEAFGGEFVLCAMAVPPFALEDVACAVNAFPEVAHNYVREHRLNLWFVLACESPEGIDEAIARIKRLTGYSIVALPRLARYALDLRLEV